MLQNRPRRIPLWVDAFLLTAVSVFYLKHSWQKWADPVIDYGREVYVPWRIISGEVLYKDLAFLYGAFPPYWNALLFKIFGPSILTLALFNIFLVSVLTVLIYKLFYKLFDRLTALMGALVFLIYFAFNQHLAQNIYYITPYSHSYPYSLFLGFCSLYIVHSYTLGPRALKLFYLGSVLGLMLLSRLEIFLTFCVPVLIGLTIFVQKNKTDVNDLLRSGVALISGFYLPLVAFLIYFSQHFSLPEALVHLIGYNSSWKEISGLEFYRFTAGWTGWPTNLKFMVITVLWYIALFLGLHMFCKGLTLRIIPGRRLLSCFLIAGAVGIFAYSVHVMGTYHVTKVFRGQMLFIILLGIFYLKIFLSSSDRKVRADALVVVVLSAWALLMLYKVPLFPVNYFYGRFHCLPGVMATVAFLVHVLPKIFETQYRSGWVVRTLICAFLMIICALAFGLSIKWTGLRQVPIGYGANKLWAYDKAYTYSSGPDVQQFLAWAEKNIKPSETYVAFPEGIMLNFLTRNKITGPHTTFMPIEMMTYTEDDMLRTLSEDPPDYFVFADRDLRFYGKIAVGYNYGTKITQWLSNEYTPVWQSVNNYAAQEFRITVFRKLNR